MSLDFLHSEALDEQDRQQRKQTRRFPAWGQRGDWSGLPVHQTPDPAPYVNERVKEWQPRGGTQRLPLKSSMLTPEDKQFLAREEEKLKQRSGQRGVHNQTRKEK